MTGILAVCTAEGVVPVLSITTPDPAGRLVDVTALLAVADFVESRANHGPGERMETWDAARPAEVGQTVPIRAS